MQPADKLKAFREKRGISPADVAAAAGISKAAYYDLESYGDLENSISLEKINALSALLNIQPYELFSSGSVSERISPNDLAVLLEKSMKKRGISLSQMEEETGWALNSFVQKPATAIQAWNIKALQDVCKAAGCKWLSVLNGMR